MGVVVVWWGCGGGVVGLWCGGVVGECGGGVVGVWWGCGGGVVGVCGGGVGGVWGRRVQSCGRGPTFLGGE